MKHKICLLVCDNYRREAEIAAQSEALPDEEIHVITYDRDCHRPAGKTSRLDLLLKQLPIDQFSTVLLVSGGCIGAQKKMPSGIQLVQMETCFEMFLPRMTIAELIRKGTYLVSPGWLLFWKRYMQDWGFDQPTARAFFGESMHRLLLLDTGCHPEAAGKLNALADFLGLAHETMPVGVDGLRHRLANFLLAGRLEREKKEAVKRTAKANRIQSEYAMAFDLLSRFNRASTEKEAAAAILSVMNLLFAPARMAYVPIKSKWLRENIYLPLRFSLVNSTESAITSGFSPEHPQSGISIPLMFSDELLALVEIHDVVMPDFLNEYRNLAIAIRPVCGLLVANARSYQQLRMEELEIQKDVQLAGVMQRALLPGDISNELFTMKCIFSPKRWVSGDFYGFRWLQEKKVLRGYLIDVAGHGVATALQTSAISAVLDSIVSHRTPDVALMLDLNQRLMSYFAEGSFAALLVFEFDFGRRCVTWITGGINRSLVGSREVSGWVTLPGAYIGILDDPELNVQVMPLAEDDSFYFMTDGLSELLEKTGVPANPSDFAGTVKQLRSGASEETRWDDCTAVCIRINCQ